MFIKNFLFVLGWLLVYGGSLVLAISIVGFICTAHLRSVGLYDESNTSKK